MEAKVSRRSFLKGATAIGGTLALGAAMSGCAAPKATGADSAKSTASDASANADAKPVASASESAQVTAESKWSFEIPPEPIADDEIASTMDADVVVVGGGTSGLVTALSALEGGLSVILISASSCPSYRGGSINAVYSKYMREIGRDKLDPTWFYRTQILANSGNVNQKLWYKYYNNSEEAMDWLIDRMTAAGLKVTLEAGSRLAYPDPMWAPDTCHTFYKDETEREDSERAGGLGLPSHQDYVVNELANCIERVGGQIFWLTKGVQLVRENNNTGDVVAVIAQTDDGSYARFEGKKAIVLATGDFSFDRDMMTRYAPEYVNLIDYDRDLDYDITVTRAGLYPGDGQKMGLWVGAAWQHAPNAVMPGQIFPCSEPYLCHTGLMVNAYGERFCNEGISGAMAANTLMHQPDYTAYCIWGTNYAEDGGPWTKRGVAYDAKPYTTEEMISTWESFDSADSLEELVKKMGLPEETLDTIERYNELCKSGADTDFYKEQKYMIPIAKAPFYCAPFTSKAITVLGGLRTDDHLQVCDEEGPIPGLFNVGSMIGDFYANYYTYQMTGMNYGACCVALPYVLGKELAEGTVGR